MPINVLWAAVWGPKCSPISVLDCGCGWINMLQHLVRMSGPVLWWFTSYPFYQKVQCVSQPPNVQTLWSSLRCASGFYPLPAPLPACCLFKASESQKLISLLSCLSNVLQWLQASADRRENWDTFGVLMPATNFWCWPFVQIRSSRSLRSSGQNLLMVPRATAETFFFTSLCICTALWRLSAKSVT